MISLKPNLGIDEHNAYILLEVFPVLLSGLSKV
jgi:hypothetical protein